MNHVTLIGNIGQAPELRHTANGNAVANFSLATNESWKGANGEKKEETTWHSCTAWKRTAEVVAQYATKGSKIAVQGSLKQRKWVKDDGQEVTQTYIHVENVELLGKPSKDESTAQTKEPRQRSVLPLGDAADDIPF